MVIKRLVVVLALLVAALGALPPAHAQFTDQRVWAGVSGGSANAQTLTVPNYDAYRVGVVVRFLPGFTNTAPTTLNINGLGVKNVFKPTAAGATALSGGEIISSPSAQIVEAVYDGTQFQITSNTNAAATQVKVRPQGYLTPCQVTSGAPVSGCTVGQALPTGDVIAATSLYFEPFDGNQIPIWNGSNMVVISFAELTLATPSSRVANTAYDVCVFSNAGVPTAVYGPAWTSSAAGTGNRGTGAGTAQITQVQGVWVNAVQISGVNGGSAYTIPANQCTVVSSVLIDSTPGQVTLNRNYGQNRKWGVWNFYNQQKIVLKAGDGTASWSYLTSAVRASNGLSANSAVSFVGLPSVLVGKFQQYVTVVAGGSSSEFNIGVCFNTTAAFSGRVGRMASPNGTGFGTSQSMLSEYVATPGNVLPAFGLNTFTACEASPATGNSVTIYGTETNMLLTVEYWG